MQKFKIKCDNEPVTLVIGVQVRRPTKVVIRVYNPYKPNTFYLDRWQTVQSAAEFEVRMPQTCSELVVEVRSLDSNDQNLRITKLQKQALQQYIPCLSGKGVKSFVKFAQEFAENASILSPGSYLSDDGKYQIDYFQQIKENGKVLTTPARISNSDGRMEISKAHFSTYSVPMRMAILLHEWSHFYANEIQKDEIEADLNALKIYLGLGYPIIEAHKSFLNVFKKSPTAQNEERYEYLKTFIDNFETMKYRLCLP